jgi:arginyl-tRNA synthetase
MYFLDKAKLKIVKDVNKALKKTALIDVDDLVFPPSNQMADISLPCFNLAKIIGKNPVEVANDLATRIKDKVCQATAVGPYLNFTLKKQVLASQVLEEILSKEKKYGQQKFGAKKRVLVEFANQNTHKEVHVGHVRNFSYGDSVTRLLRANGFLAMPFSYINDFGINTARVIWGLDKFYVGKKLPKNKGEFLGKLYAEATKKQEELGDEAKNEVGEYMRAIESRQGPIYDKWLETRLWSIASFKKVYKELDIKFVDTWYESQYIEEGFRLVQELKAKNILIESQGAIIADLEKYNLGIQVYLRANGTALYPVADLALAQAKVKHFNIDESIIAVDIRQSLHFKQLFKVMELLGYKQKMVHLGHEFVTLPSGMMSSRTGNVITYEDLRADMLMNALSSTREKHPEWELKKLLEVATKIAIGAMKFEMIKVSREKTIVFDIEKSLRFDGFTAAYLQYTGARINSILKKITEPAFEIDYAKLTVPKEHELILQLAKYPSIVATAGVDYEPAEIAKYLFDLAQIFNDYYHAVPVLKVEKLIMQARIILIGAVKQVLTNGLDLLGIDFIEEM